MLWRAMVSIISFSTNEVWVFVVSLWNTGVTVCLYTKKLNWASSLHLHAGMYFPLVQNKGFAVQGGFCCCCWLWGFFLFLTKLMLCLVYEDVAFYLFLPQILKTQVIAYFLCSLWRTSSVLWGHTKARCFHCLSWAFFSPKEGTEAVWKCFLGT